MCYMDWWEGAGVVKGQPTEQGRAPRVWLAKAKGLDSVNSDSQWDLTSGMLKVNGCALGELGELLSLGRQSSALWWNKGTGECHLPLPSPSQNPTGNQFLSLNLLVPCKHPMLCFCGSNPLMGLPASLPVLQGPSHRGPLTAKPVEPAPPTPVHLVDLPWLIRQIPSKQHHKPGSVQVARMGHTTAQ